MTDSNLVGTSFAGTNTKDLKLQLYIESDDGTKIEGIGGENTKVKEIHLPVYKASEKNKNRRYLFWTSVNVSNFPTGTKIPVIICRADNEYYVSESTTAERTGDKITTLYKVIADHQYNAESYQKIADKGTKYDSLQAAYDAYVEKITEDSNYSQFKDTLSKN